MNKRRYSEFGHTSGQSSKTRV